MRHRWRQFFGLILCLPILLLVNQHYIWPSIFGKHSPNKKGLISVVEDNRTNQNRDERKEIPSLDDWKRTEENKNEAVIEADVEKNETINVLRMPSDGHDLNPIIPISTDKQIMHPPSTTTTVAPATQFELPISYHYSPHLLEGKRKCPKIHGKIGILIVYTNPSQYMHGTNVMWCYAISRGYEFFLVQPFTDPLSMEKCNRYPDVMFRKHCVAAEYLDKVDYLFVTDADTAVINADHCLEEWIDPTVDILLYERFFSAEVMSGHYIAKNSAGAKRFMREWAEIEITDPPPDGYFFSADNGAVHLEVLRLLYPKRKPMIKYCLSMVRLSKWPDWEPAYGAFVRCAKSQMIAYDPVKEGPAWARVRMLSRGQAWVRDAYLSDYNFWKNDFWTHNVKTEEPFDPTFLKRLTPLWANSIPLECLNPDWKPKLKHGELISENELRTALNASIVSLETMKLKTLFANPDFSCWPRCPLVFETLTKQQLKSMKNRNNVKI